MSDIRDIHTHIRSPKKNEERKRGRHFFMAISCLQLMGNLHSNLFRDIRGRSNNDAPSNARKQHPLQSQVK